MSWKTLKLLYRKFIQDNMYQLYQNRLSFAEDMTKTFWCFFGSQCSFDGTVLWFNPLDPNSSNYYSATVGVRSIVINPSVCASVYLSASISLEPLDRSARNCVCGFPVAVAAFCDSGAVYKCHDLLTYLLRRGSVLLRRRCDIVCTSGFVDDVTFGRNWRDTESGGWQVQRRQ